MSGSFITAGILLAHLGYSKSGVEDVMGGGCKHGRDLSKPSPELKLNG